jgi:hypothetical protein
MNTVYIIVLLKHTDTGKTKTWNAISYEGSKEVRELITYTWPYQAQCAEFTIPVCYHKLTGMSANYSARMTQQRLEQNSEVTDYTLHCRATVVSHTATDLMKGNADLSLPHVNEHG